MGPLPGADSACSPLHKTLSPQSFRFGLHDDAGALLMDGDVLRLRDADRDLSEPGWARGPLFRCNCQRATPAPASLEEEASCRFPSK
jgi:hypothetical protein